MSSEVGEGPSTSSSPSKEKMEAKVKAMNLLAQGKRNLICGEIPAAVQQFQDACQTLSAAYGEMARECAEAYFQYGSALLELARMEQGVLGNALEGVDVEADDNMESDNKDQFEPAENVDGGSGKEAEDEGEKTEDTEEEEEEEGNEDGEGEEEEEGGDAAESQEEGEAKDGEEDPDDISNLQLAWEMLELSKIIYSKDPSKESQVKAAESCLKLGEVSLESEQYEQAIADLQLCLTTQKEHLEPCDRAIAETYYNLGMAYQMNKQFDQAIDSYKSAVKCLEEKIEKLKIVVKEKPPKDPSQFVEPAESAEKEIQQIQALLPDIKEKIADSEEEVKEIENLKKMAKEAMGAVFSAVVNSTSETGFGSSSKSPATSSEDKKATNISHLIRKKRKPDGEDDDPENKKQKQESEGGSGDGPEPVQNGHAEKKDDAAETVAAT